MALDEDTAQRRESVIRADQAERPRADDDRPSTPSGDNDLSDGGRALRHPKERPQGDREPRAG
jgi:hypothetical protein